MCIDHPVVQAMIPRLSDRKVVTYGFSPQADIRAVGLEMSSAGCEFNVQITDRAEDTVRSLPAVRLPMPGRHNAQNALAAIAVAIEMRIDDQVIRAALADFAGVKRRFTRTGEAGGVTVIDDYGHHPVEISAALSAARTTCRGRVIAVVQPHRYSRLNSLFEDFCTCFNDADTVIVADVYAAGEAPIENIDRDALVAGLRHHGHRSVVPLDDPEDLAAIVHAHGRPGDLVVCLGAGTVTNWAQALPDALAAMEGGREVPAGQAR